jgi:prepilin-type N-terminal cleavage/methylation domain-containing protein
MYSSHSRGFTLIEILVVVAIIGILSAVVLASLTIARNKGLDAAIQADLSTVQTQAELYAAGVGANTYGSARSLAGCPTSSGGGSMFYSDANIKAAIVAADQAAGGTGVQPTTKVYCGVNGAQSAYAVQATLVNGITSGGTTYMVWCIDSIGNAKPEVSLSTGASVCP